MWRSGNDQVLERKSEHSEIFLLVYQTQYTFPNTQAMSSSECFPIPILNSFKNPVIKETLDVKKRMKYG